MPSFIKVNMGGLREIVLDTETTGTKLRDGHRIIEIGCVELIDKCKTGEIFHSYVNPNRVVDREAFRVHGLSEEFLSDKAQFAEIAAELVAFMGQDKLVIHNAPFDVGFLNHELELLGLPRIEMNRVVDTLILARKKYPGAPASLDALCRRFDICLEMRAKHGALVDAELLAAVYIMMDEKMQSRMDLQEMDGDELRAECIKAGSFASRRRVVELTEDEAEAHEAMKLKLTDPIWDKIAV